MNGLRAVSGLAVALLGFTLLAPAAQAAMPVPCDQLRNLRDLAPDLQYVTNPNTGDTLDYVVIGDAAKSNDLLVFFNGTGQILPDWPIQMLTNSTYSPAIVDTVGYKASEDGPVSLCHDYHLLLFDYPGVGEDRLHQKQVTKDQVANDVDAMLQDASTRYGISTQVVDPVGWSLGTTDALKFSLLSPKARPGRAIRNIVLIATDPGGYTTPAGYGTGPASPDEGACIGTMFGALKTASSSRLKLQLSDLLTKLVFPYVGQTARDNGTRSRCTATVLDNQVELSVTPSCTVANNCKAFVINSLLNRATLPWFLTHGVNHALYLQQRAQGNDWAVDYCGAAGPAFASIDCESYGAVLQSVTNGGVCRTNTSLINHPVAIRCADLHFTGRIGVLNGYEDLYVQWTYGKALVDAYNRKRPGSAVLLTYRGKAGHGILIQHPMWTQDSIEKIMQGCGCTPFRIGPYKKRRTGRRPPLPRHR